MKQSEVLASLKRYVSHEILDGKDIGLDGSTPLLEWGIINSMEMARLVSFIEDRFGVEIPGEKIVFEYFRDLTTITSLVLELAQADLAKPRKA